MPDAVIFDFDGVVVDSEPIHLMAFRRVLRPAGVTLTDKDYYGRYLGYDDHDCFQAAGKDNGADFSEQQIAEMTAAKTAIVKNAIAESIQPQPGAVELIAAAAEAGIPLAVCSGALRDEIELAAATIDVRETFVTIVSAEDVSRGKPDPEGYRLVLARLDDALGRKLAAGCCVVIEDAPAGIEAAKAAGIKVLAVTSSYPAGALAAADRVVTSLADVTLASLDQLV